MFGRRLRSVLDMITPGPTIVETVAKNQSRQKKNHDGVIPRNLNLKPDDSVMVRNYSQREERKWIPATILKGTGHLSYKCRTNGGDVIRRHADQVIAATTPPTNITPKGEGETNVLRRSSRQSKPPERLQVGK
eukprot:TRINITY_DN2783_c0_g1_i10.p2 TRINITY_DN2783_c0_g1~~TRINITY_DN2783_c0_g1_i10.p2  ORF type:complete len:133 (-),score=12.30 TRINITY_DN2783_c0_g1_i10:180-578(-)